jgi:hypothetical protein
MTPEQKRTFNTTVGGLFLGLGVLAWGFATYYTFTPHAPKPAPTLASKVDFETCRQAVGAMGFSATEKEGGRIELRQTVIEEDAQRQLMTASLASSVCKMNLETFCMGEGCAEKGVSMTLTPSIQEVKKVPPPKASATRTPPKKR